MSAVGTPKLGFFWLFGALGVACLLLLNLEFAPDWLAEGDEAGADAEPAAIAEPAPSVSATPAAPRVPAAARVPTIVARFGTESKEPLDESGIRALATAMIEDHEARVVLEGHSDTLGAEDFNHDLSLERANLVKARLVTLGVSEERIETVGLAATRPLHSDTPDAASVNRRVEVRWVGKAEFEVRRKNPDAPRMAPAPAPAPAAPPSPAVVASALADAGPKARAPDVVDAGNTVGSMVVEAGSSAPVVPTDSDSGPSEGRE